MILKNYIQFINESKQIDFTFVLEQDCGDCGGAGMIKHGVCGHCSGAGFSKEWEYDEETGIEMDHDVDCTNCNGTGEVEAACETCEEGNLEWNLEFRQGEGIINMYEKYGNSDYPLLYDDGDVRWDHPEMFPAEIKEITKFIMHNKDLPLQELTNKMVRYMIEEEYFEEYEISEEMIEMLDEDTKRIIASTKGINKYDL